MRKFVIRLIVAMGLLIAVSAPVVADTVPVPICYPKPCPEN
jgi:hypothetical protein